MAEHTTFGVACCATGVDKTAALTGLLPSHLGVNDLVFHCNACLDEIFPEEETGPRAAFR